MSANEYISKISISHLVIDSNKRHILTEVNTALSNLHKDRHEALLYVGWCYACGRHP